MGVIAGNLQLTHHSGNGFLRLLDFLLSEIPPRRMLTAHRSKPPAHEVFEFYPHAVFDFPLHGGKRMIFDAGGGTPHAEILTPGDVFLLPPSAWKLPEWRLPHEMASLVLQDKFIRLTYVELAEPTGGRPVCNCFFHTSRPPSAEIRTLTALLERIGLEGDGIDAAPELLRALLRLVRHALADDRPPELPKAWMTFRKIRQYLLENYANEITREETARKFQLNPAYLSRLFREKEGCSFSAFRSRLRLEHAAMLLRRTDLLVDEIADSCGYRSSTFFTAAFKQHYGMPPGRFRCCGFPTQKKSEKQADSIENAD